MARLKPFKALRPLPSNAQKIASVPYDVINTEEARQMAAGNDLSFLHVIRPEIDLPLDIDEHDEAVYQKGASNLKAFHNSDAFTVEDEPMLYLYRIIMNGRSQTGIYGCVSVEDYDNNVILKHELTRPDKEDDRTKHIVTQQAHAEPVMLTFKDDHSVGEIISKTLKEDPLFDFVADDGVQHSIWKIESTEELVNAFGRIDNLYVADGHHRCKAASRAYNETENSPSESGFFPAVLFPMTEMKILAYNRIIFKLPENSETFLKRLHNRFELEEDASPRPSSPGNISIYLSGKWYSLELPDSGSDKVSEQLDVARLGEHLLQPMLNITDPRTDQNIYFVGGIRGTAELEKLVDSGKAQMAISMYPTSIEELIDVSDAGELMPPKSTWFEPKLRSGLLVHQF